MDLILYNLNTSEGIKIEKPDTDIRLKTERGLFRVYEERGELVVMQIQPTYMVVTPVPGNVIRLRGEDI